MNKKFHSLTITVYDRQKAFPHVSKLLHRYAKHIHLRVGYPMKKYNIAVIFIIIELTNDELGAFSGRLGQERSVKVNSTTLKLERE